MKTGLSEDELTETISLHIDMNQVELTNKWLVCPGLPRNLFRTYTIVGVFRDAIEAAYAISCSYGAIEKRRLL